MLLNWINLNMPLHPAVVHIPVGIALILPLIALTVQFVTQKGWAPERAWLSVVLLQSLVLVSAYVAVETGEHQWETVAKIVPEAALAAHAHAGELFFRSSIGVWILTITGLLPLAPKTSHILRWVSCAALCVGAFLVAEAGHHGGEVVYQYGACGAYVEKAVPPSAQ